MKYLTTVRRMMMGVVMTTLALGLTATAALGQHETPSVDEPGQITAIAPGIDLGMLETATSPTTTTSATNAQPQEAPFQLGNVRVRPLADRLRLVFLFDRPAPYTVRLDAANRRAYLDLVHTNIDFLPSELGRLGEDRLDGLWLTQNDPALCILELRLPTDAMRIEHFSLAQPACIVLDLMRTDTQVVRIPSQGQGQGSYRTALAPATPQSEPGVVRQEGGSVLPMMDTAAASQELQTQPGQEQEPASPTPLPSQPTMAVEHQTAMAQDFTPLEVDFDFFPISSVSNVKTPLAEEILDDFLHRRWAEVISKGVKQYLPNTAMNQEAVYVLYMVAEAHWQLHLDQTPEPMLEMRNYYEQAMRVHSGGDLGAFGHWRLAQLAWELDDAPRALLHLDKAVLSEQPHVRQAAQLMRLRMLTQMGEYSQALAQITELRKQMKDRDQQVELDLIEGEIWYKQNSWENAWRVYSHANQLDSGWINLDVESCERMAKAAMEVGELESAHYYLLFIHDNFVFKDESRDVKLALMLAEVLALKGETKTAMDTYAALLNLMGGTPKGELVQQQMYRDYPEEVVRSEKLYCLMLWKQGQIRKAMSELDRAYNQSVEEGVDTKALYPAIQTILPSFLEESIQNEQPFDVAQAWQLYSHAITDEATRQRCLLPLAQAMELIKLPENALTLINQMTSDVQTRPAVRLLRARLHLQTGQVKESIALLESLVVDLHDPVMLTEAYALLAKAYLQNSRKLEAAQAYQALTRMSDVDAPMMGDALLNSGRLFLSEGLPRQTIELALKGLLFEKQWSDEKVRNGWSGQTSEELRMMLARAYDAQGDYLRQILVLESYLQEGQLDVEELAQAQTMIAAANEKLAREQNNEEQAKHFEDMALERYNALANDRNTPRLWRRIAEQSIQRINWNRNHPNWRVQ